MSNLNFDQAEFFFNTRTKFKDYLYLAKSPIQEDWFNQLNLHEDEQEKIVIARLENKEIVVFLSVVSTNKDFENRLIRYTFVCKFELTDQLKHMMINLSYLMIKDKAKLLAFFDKQMDLIDPFFKETLSIDVQKQKLNTLKNRIFNQFMELSFHKDYLNFQSISDQFEQIHNKINQTIDKNLNDPQDLSDFFRTINALISMQKPFYLAYRPFETQSLDMIDLSINQSIKNFDQMYIAVFYTMQDAKGKISKASSKLIYQKLKEKELKEMNGHLNVGKTSQEIKYHNSFKYLIISITLNLILIGAGGWFIHDILSQLKTRQSTIEQKINHFKNEKDEKDKKDEKLNKKFDEYYKKTEIDEKLKNINNRINEITQSNHTSNVVSKGQVNPSSNSSNSSNSITPPEQ